MLKLSSANKPSSVPIIVSADILATNMAFYNQYRHRYRGLISLSIFIVAVIELIGFLHHPRLFSGNGLLFTVQQELRCQKPHKYI